ncbi:MAG: sodium/proline symporter [Gammaproteobacteria bacterium]|nr:sodium/proline symporter [Gammaproteobacteria bacterium]
MLIAILIGYQIVLVGIGLWARNRSASHDDFLIGGRRMGALVASLSYAAGASSAWSILGVTGIAYTQGISAVWLLPGTITGHIVAWFFIAPRLRRLAAERQYVTLTDFLVDGLEARERRAAIVVSSAAILFCFSFYVAAQFQGAGTTLAASFDISATAAIVIGAAIILLYTCLGGFWAVSITDSLQAVVMFVAALVLPSAVLVELGGFAPIFAALEPEHVSPTGANAGWLAAGFLLGMVSIGFGPLGQPHMLNRMMALADEGALSRARVIALAWFVVVLGGMFIAGLAGHALLDQVPEPESLLFQLSEALLPAVVGALLTVAVLSAVMSTADSQLLVAAGVASHDLARTDGRANSRIYVVLVGIVAVLLALFLPETIFARVLFAWNALGATFGPLVMRRLLGRPINPTMAPVAMGAGFALTVLFYSLPDTPGDVAERALPFVVGWLILMLPKRG